MTGRELRDFGKGMAFCSPWVIGFLIFTLLPVILSFYYSLCDYPLLQPPLYVGLDNYADLMHDPVFSLSLGNTFYYAAMALPAGLMVSLGLALLLNQPIKRQAIYRTIIFLPSLVPAVASAMLWLYLLNAKLGLVNGLLSGIGVHGAISMQWLNHWLGLRGEAAVNDFALPPQWLVDPRVAMPTFALMSLWGVGNTVVIYLAGLQDVPRELYEAADLDGAGTWGRLWHVTLPTISPVIFFNLVMGIIGSLQMFAGPFIMTGGGPDRATYFYTMYLYDNAFRFLNMGKASAMAWILLLIVLVLTSIAFWTSKKWVHYQGK